MQKVILAVTVFVFITTASIGIHAQEKKKNDTNKPQTTTIDAWRRAFPQIQEESTDVPAYPTRTDPEITEEYVESAAEIEKTIVDLERKLMTAFKQSDAGTLSYLLADDFMAVGENLNDTQPNKIGYIQWVSKNPKFKSYKLDKISIRIFGKTAIATVHYKHQAAATGSSVNEDFIVTDVWVKNGDLWQAVSHHVSRMPKS